VDQVIVGHTAAGSVEADLLGLPTISVTLMPQAIPVHDPTQPLLKRLVMKLAGAGMGLMMTRPLNQIRRRAGLPPMGPMGITSALLNLIAVSPMVFPPDPRWEARHQMTGYWFADEPRGWMPPDHLCKFLAAGEPPVVISLGAMSTGEADAYETAQIMIGAVQRAGVRAIVQGWERALGHMALPQTILPLGSAPHSWLLEQSRGVVHHGGFGTTGAGLRAGIPSLVIPHIIDQFIWGKRVHELGAGPPPIPRGKLTVERLAGALIELVRDEGMCQQAGKIGQKIRQERGVENAVRLIEGVLQSS
jgi:UDP:flavonoid glycosyltransferase YjiC (YdhE family)